MKSIVFYTHLLEPNLTIPHYHQFHHLHSPPIYWNHRIPTGATGFTELNNLSYWGYIYPTGIGITYPTGAISYRNRNNLSYWGYISYHISYRNRNNCILLGPTGIGITLSYWRNRFRDSSHIWNNNF